MGELGLGTDLELWQSVPEAPEGWQPARRPFRDFMSVVLAAWQGTQARGLAPRRPAFGHVAGDIDIWASRRLLASGALSRDAAGALRTVMAGAAATESIATRWSGRSAACPP